jgi:hypothetical protein
MREVRDDLKLGPVLNQNNHPANDLGEPDLAHAHTIMDA